MWIFYYNDISQNPLKKYRSHFGKRTNSNFFNKLKNLTFANKQTYVNNPKAYVELENNVVEIMTNLSDRGSKNID